MFNTSPGTLFGVQPYYSQLWKCYHIQQQNPINPLLGSNCPYSRQKPHPGLRIDLKKALKGWKQEFFLTLILSAITPNQDKMKQSCFQILKKFMVVHYKNYKLMSDVTF